MVLSGNGLLPYVYGAYKINETDGYLSFTRFEQAQMDRLNELSPDGFLRRGALVNASVTVEFITDAEELSVCCRFPEIQTDLDTLDVLCNGVPVAVYCIADLPEGENVLSAKLPAGRKHVAIYLPCDSLAEIREIRVSGNVDNVKKGDKVLFIGDSITQGYGVYLASGTYVNALCRIKNYQPLNQGIGGYYYDEKSVVKLDFTPDKIIIALGTNQFKSPDKAERIKEFYKALKKLYPNTPVVALTPIWREIGEGEMPLLLETAEIIRTECAKYSIPVIDGFSLVPNRSRYFKDGLHPNATGALIYALNLAGALEKLGF